jgi:hypothetical protein
VLLFFLDGVGLGGPDPARNPFVSAQMPHLTALLGEGWFLQGNGRIHTSRASFVPTDASLGVDGRPQSATGQAAILTGQNVPRLIGEHYGPKPNQAVRNCLQQGTLFHDAVARQEAAALLTPYPPQFFQAIASGKRIYSSVPQAVVAAGLPLLTVDDLRNGTAVSPTFTGQGWRDVLGIADVPILTLAQAGQRIATLAQKHRFSFFEHWPSDRAGHRGTLAEAAAHLQMVDEVIGGLLAGWDDQNGLLILTSDHGNIEEKEHRLHTRNPVPTLLVGRNHAQWAAQINDLTDIAGVVRQALDW